MNRPIPVYDYTGTADPGLLGGGGGVQTHRDLIVQELLQALMSQRASRSTPSYSQLVEGGAPDLPARAGRSLQGLGGSIRPDVTSQNPLGRMAALPGQLSANTADFWGSLLQMREPQISGMTDAVTESIRGAIDDPQKALSRIGAAITQDDMPLKLAESLQWGDVTGLGMAGFIGRKNLAKLLSDASENFEYPMATPVSGQTISTRFPTAPGSTENPLTERLIVDMESARAAPTDKTTKIPFVEKMARKLSEHPTMRRRGTALDFEDPEEIIGYMKEYERGNLKWLHDSMDPSLRERAKLWYDGANRLANEFSKYYDVPIQSAAGVMAALSPQMDWFQNVALAERVLDTVKNNSSHRFTDSQSDLARKIFLDDPKKSQRSKRENGMIIKYLKGKTLNDLRGPLKKPELMQSIQGDDASIDSRIRGMWVRMFDESYRDKTYRNVSPEGYFLDVNNSNIAWGGNGDIGKAVNVIFDSSIDNVSKQMGQAHKVRNFFNNITAPNADMGDVTIDTHAVGAAQMKPLSGSSPEVKINLQGPPKNAPSGLSGTYPFHADAYRELAKSLGIQPRELQSITWEQIRALFSPEFKRKYSGESADPKVTREVDHLVSRMAKGEITPQEMRESFKSMVGGFDDLTWAKKSPTGEEFRPQIRKRPKDTLKTLARAAND